MTVTFRIIGPMLLLLGATAAQDSRASADLGAQLGYAQTPDAIRAAVQAVERFLEANPKSPDAPLLVCGIGYAWRRLGAHEEALRTFERIGREWGETHAGHALIGAAGVHHDLGDWDKAIALLERATTAPARDTHRSIMDASNTMNSAFEALAEIHERRKDWKRALEALERWKPTSWCGTCGVSIAWSRDVRIATCRFELGDVAAALGTLEPIVSNDGGMWNDAGTRACMFYAEYAARGGQLDRARKLVAAAPKAQERLAVPMKIAEAWAARNAAGIVDALRDFPIHSMGGEVNYRAAGTLLTELGPAGEKVLNDGVAAGDPIVLAIQQALERLRSESRPASRRSK